MSDERKENILQKLTETRQALFDFARSLGPEEWTQPVYIHDREWTAADVLRHLTDAERGMMGTMQKIRETGKGVPEDFDLDRWNASRVAKMQDMMPAELLAEMEQNREALLAFVDDLAEKEWDKAGRHASLRIMTLEEILQRIADHEQEHLADMRAALV